MSHIFYFPSFAPSKTQICSYIVCICMVLFITNFTFQKRLEQDFNTVQEMMQQKEKELATLHEETDAQVIQDLEKLSM